MIEEACKQHLLLVAPDEVLDDPKNKGKRYNVSDKIKRNKEKLQIIVDYVKNIGALLSGRLNQTDIFITFDEKNKQEILDSLRYSYECKLLTFQELLNSVAK